MTYKTLMLLTSSLALTLSVPAFAKDGEHRAAHHEKVEAAKEAHQEKVEEHKEAVKERIESRQERREKRREEWRKNHPKVSGGATQ